MNLLDASIFSFVIIAILAGVLVLQSKEGDKTSKILWFIFMTFLAYNLFYIVMFWSGVNKDLVKMLSPFYFIPISLYGPLFYLFVKRRIGGAEVVNKKLFLHLLPLFFVLVSFPFATLLPSAVQELFYAKGMIGEYGSLINPFVISNFLSVTLICYGIGSYIFYRNYNLGTSSLSGMLYKIILAYLGYSFVRLSISILLAVDSFRAQYYFLITITTILFIALVLVTIYKFPALFTGKALNQLIPSKKYSNTGMSRQLFNQYKVKLLEEMTKNKIFLDSDIRLDDLSMLLGISRNHTSQLINEYFKLNFFDFMNKYRIQEVQSQLLNNPSSSSIMEIAYNSGFNNKVSFYKAFKKNVGSTPTAFLEKNIKSFK